MKSSSIWNVIHKLKPAVLMVVVQVSFAGVNILYKLAVNDGMNLKVVAAYRFIFATAFMAPLALFFERTKRPKMTWTILFQAFLCGLFGGALAQNFYLEALSLTSATFASALANLIPPITFILAVSFRLEKLNLERAAGKAKVIGTVIGLSGAMTLTFLKGREIPTGSHISLLHHHDHRHVSPSSASSSTTKTLLGALCAFCSCSSYATWLIIQTKLSDKYPSYYSSTALMSFMASLVAVAFGLCVERDWNQWKLGWNVRLLTVAYSGMVASGVMVVMIAWCAHMKGPLFVSVFSPLMLVIVALAGCFMLDEKLYLGSIIGGVLIVCGLYVVLWGKGKEMKKRNQLVPSSQSSTNDVEVIVRSPAEDKSSHHSENNGAQVLLVHGNDRNIHEQYSSETRSDDDGHNQQE